MLLKGKRHFFLREERPQIVLWAALTLIFLMGFDEAGIPDAWYYLFLSFFLEGVYLARKGFSMRKAHMERLAQTRFILEEAPSKGTTLLDLDYQEMDRKLREKIHELEKKIESREEEDREYYSLWIHQIKTPIQAVELLMKDNDGKRDKEITREIFRIREYVEMILTYTRLEESESDLLIEEVCLETLVRALVMEYASQFIGKKLSISLENLNHSILTDKKWLGFIIGQLLSNALKYTDEGGVRVRYEEEEGAFGTLLVEDTGIGIGSEDIERIFEKGFTGKNGREDMRASGIGLYLCKESARRIGASLEVERGRERGACLKVKFNPKVNVLE